MQPQHIIFASGCTSYNYVMQMIILEFFFFMLRFSYLQGLLGVWKFQNFSSFNVL